MQQDYPGRVWPYARRVCPFCHQDAPAWPYNRLGQHGPCGEQAVCPASGSTFAAASRLRDLLSEAAILASRCAPAAAHLTRAEARALDAGAAADLLATRLTTAWLAQARERRERMLARRLEEYFHVPHRARAAIVQALRLAQDALGHLPRSNRELSEFGTIAARIHNTQLQPGAVLAPRFFREFYAARDVGSGDGEPRVRR